MVIKHRLGSKPTLLVLKFIRLMHTGVSAVMNSATLIEWISRQNENSIRTKQEQDKEFDPPYTTLHVGTIRGGTAGNITAKDCRFLIDIRCLPSESGKQWVKKYKNFAKKVELKMKKVNSNSSISVTDIHWVEGLKPEKDSYAETLVRQLTSKNDTEMVSYGTEAGQFQAAGYSTIICGLDQ